MFRGRRNRTPRTATAAEFRNTQLRRGKRRPSPLRRAELPPVTAGAARLRRYRGLRPTTPIIRLRPIQRRRPMERAVRRAATPEATTARTQQHQATIRDVVPMGHPVRRRAIPTVAMDRARRIPAVAMDRRRLTLLAVTDRLRPIAAGAWDRRPRRTTQVEAAAIAAVVVVAVITVAEAADRTPPAVAVGTTDASITANRVAHGRPAMGRPFFLLSLP
jgi:hypothetical protein